MDEKDFQALCLVSSLLSTETIGMFTRKGMLTMDEASEIFDHCLLNLEMRIGNAASADVPALQAAREIFEAALVQIDSQRSDQQPRNG